MEKLLTEFCKYRKLRPLKIILNCRSQDLRSHYSVKLSRFYNIPIINYSSLIRTLSVDENTLEEEELKMYAPYLKIKQNLKAEKNEEKKNILMFETLKQMLKDNECKNRGYILTGMPVNEEENLLEYNSFYLGKSEEPLVEGDEGYEPPDMDDDVQPADMGMSNDAMGDNTVDNMGDNMAGDVLDDKPKKKEKKPIKMKTVVKFHKELIPESFITLREGIYIIIKLRTPILIYYQDPPKNINKNSILIRTILK
jgi:hypothetical protein